MAVPTDDEELLRAIADGDGDAAESFDHAFRKRLECIARASGVRSEDSCDVVQQVLFEAYKQIRLDHRRIQHLPAWLVGLLKHKIADHFRAIEPQSRRLSYGASWNDDDRAEPLVPVCSGDRDTVLIVQEVLRHMPAEHRLILVLNVHGGYTIEQIAKRLGRSKGRVGALLAESKRMFRDGVSGCETKSLRRRLQ